MTFGLIDSKRVVGGAAFTLNTAGAKLILLNIKGGADKTPFAGNFDALTNAGWVAGAYRQQGGYTDQTLYCLNPSDTSATHSFNVPEVGFIHAYAFSATGVAALQAEVTGDSATVAGTATTGGGLTPASDGALVFASLETGWSTVSGLAVSDGLTIGLSNLDINNEATAYLFQSTAAAVAPQFSWTTAVNWLRGLMVFTVAPAPPVPPTITTHPANASRQEGQTATFSVAATGDTPITVQWQKDGTNISGATSSPYTTPALVLADNGATYRAVVTNAAGSATSNNATLTVTAAGSPPGVSGSIAAPTINSASVTVPFTPGPGADSHDIELSTNGGSTYAAAVNVTGSTFPIAAAVIGTTYTVRITAKNASGNATATAAGTVTISLGSASGGGGAFTAALLMAWGA